MHWNIVVAMCARSHTTVSRFMLDNWHVLPSKVHTSCACASWHSCRESSWHHSIHMLMHVWIAHNQTWVMSLFCKSTTSCLLWDTFGRWTSSQKFPCLAQICAAIQYTIQAGIFSQSPSNLYKHLFLNDAQAISSMLHVAASKGKVDVMAMLMKAADDVDVDVLDAYVSWYLLTVGSDNYRRCS